MINRFVKPLALLAILTIASALRCVASEEKSMTSEELVAVISKLDALTLVTPERVPMRPWVALLCRMPTNKDKDHAVLTSRNALYKVFVSASGAEAMKDEKAAFPIGAVIVKQKFAKKDDDTPILYTGMLKREKGFNPDCGDWEFFLVGGDGKKITERGKIKSCMDCHTQYPTSDFVTKNYRQ